MRVCNARAYRSVFCGANAVRVREPARVALALDLLIAPRVNFRIAALKHPAGVNAAHSSKSAVQHEYSGDAMRLNPTIK
jgi:hypothetical protein